MDEVLLVKVYALRNDPRGRYRIEIGDRVFYSGGIGTGHNVLINVDTNISWALPAFPWMRPDRTHILDETGIFNDS